MIRRDGEEEKQERNKNEIQYKFYNSTLALSHSLLAQDIIFQYKHEAQRAKAKRAAVE